MNMMLVIGIVILLCGKTGFMLTDDAKSIIYVGDDETPNRQEGEGEKKKVDIEDDEVVSLEKKPQKPQKPPTPQKPSRPSRVKPSKPSHHVFDDDDDLYNSPSMFADDDDDDEDDYYGNSFLSKPSHSIGDDIDIPVHAGNDLNSAFSKPKMRGRSEERPAMKGVKNPFGSSGDYSDMADDALEDVYGQSRRRRR